MHLIPSRRWLRWLLGTVLFIVLLWLLLWAVVPIVAKSQLEKQLGAKLGRQVHVGKVEFAPWSLEATVRDLVIERAAAAPAMATGAAPTPSTASTEQEDTRLPQLQIQRIYVDASAQSLLRLAPVLDAIEIDAPTIRLTQHDWGKFDIDDILAKLGETPPDPDAKPVQFALYNIALRDARLELFDEQVQRKHEVSAFNLGIPFISNLPSKREIKVQPHLSFTLNGSRFESQAQSTPFLDNRQTAVQLQWKNIDLTPYLGYLPPSVPVRPLSGVVDTDLQIAFEQNPEAVLRINGTLLLSKVEVQDRQQAPLLRFDELEARLDDVRPLQSQVQLQSLRVKNPKIFASRDAEGRINWQALAAPSPATGAAVDAGAGAKQPANPLHFALQQLHIDNATVHWQDAATGASTARLTASPLNIKIDDVRWPMDKPMQLDLQTGLQASTGAADAKATAAATATAPSPSLQLRGSLTPQEGKLAVAIAQLPLQWAAPYLAAHFQPEIGGRLQADAGLGWNGAAMAVHVGTLNVTQWQLKDKQAPAQFDELQLKNAQIDLSRQTVGIEQISLQKPQLSVLRNPQGQWMFEPWLPSAKPAPATKATTDKPWRVALEALAIDGGSLQFRDEAAAPHSQALDAAARTVAVDLSSLRVRLGKFEPLATRAAPTPLELSAKIGTGRKVQAGSLSFRGDFGLAPMSAQGQVQALSLPLHAFEPYFGDLLNVELVRADGNFKGQVRYAAQPKGPQLQVQGDAGLNDLRMRSALASPVQNADAAGAAKPRTAAGAVAAVLTDSTADRARSQASGTGLRDDLLTWKTLAVRGLDLQMRPEKPLQVSVRETALSDFFARVIVQRNGRLNLQDIVKTARSEASLQQNTEATTPETPEKKTTPEPATGAQAAINPEAGIAPIIKVGPIMLTGGKVQFSDYFIQPNYSADLSELTGRLSEFASQPPQGQQEPLMADLELRGRAQGTASLDITGKINPLAKPLALDVRAQMRDLELSPLTPYSIKYAGHGIERGKLAMDVNYKVLPDGQLTASNKLVLHQLTFGEAVPGAPASLPVRLAVALLADRNGVIDLDVPISGSLNDPQFRLAPIIFKVIGNIIMKAVTAPFALLSGAFSGGDESGAVAFAPGSATLDAKAKENLTKIVKSLSDRPALKMTVVGEAREAEDRQAWKLQELNRQLLAQKRRQAIRDGKAADTVTEITEAERPSLLKAVYGRSDIKKPRNMVGLAKDLPAAQMQAMLIDSINVPDDAMRELALARGVAVRDYLASQQLPLERLFLGAPRVGADDKEWTPRAQLSLSTN